MTLDFKIYIVDDEEIIREGIRLTLGKRYTLLGFEDAESAIEAMETDPPDLVLLDIGLPGLSGIEALEAIKEQNREIIVIMISKETFRKDLFFRLGVIRINLPSLNDRPEDIELLANYFIGNFSEKFNIPGVTLSRAVLELLMQYSWRGNVRELKNMMERGVLTAQGLCKNFVCEKCYISDGCFESQQISS